jgi:hypothetical protein
LPKDRQAMIRQALANTKALTFTPEEYKDVPSQEVLLEALCYHEYLHF